MFKIRNTHRSQIVSIRILLSLSMLLLSLPTQANTKMLGRLFSTPTERALLDRIREHVKPGELIGLPEENIDPIIPMEVPPPQFTLNGYVKRSSGKETIWLNQVAHSEIPKDEGFKVRQKLSKLPVVAIRLPNGQQLRLKAGQTFDTYTGKTREAYERPAKLKANEANILVTPAVNAESTHNK